MQLFRQQLHMFVNVFETQSQTEKFVNACLSLKTVNHGGGLLDGVFLPPESEQTTGAGMSGGSFLGPSNWGFGVLPQPGEDTAGKTNLHQ